MLCTVLLALSASLAAQAPSQQPPQVASATPESKRSTTSNDHGGHAKQSTKSHQNGGQKMPGSVDEDKAPTQDEQPTQQQESQNADQERLTRYTLWLAIVTGLMSLATASAVIVAIFYTSYAKRQAKAMEDAVEASQKQLEALDRPWIKADVSVAEPMLLSSGGPQFAFQFIFTNIGHSVATHVYYNAEITVPTSGVGPEYRQQIADQELRVRNQTQTVSKTIEGSGLTLFPGEQVAVGLAIVVNESQIEAGAFKLNKERPERSWNPILVGCVMYEMPNSRVPHHTSFAYEIRRRLAGKPTSRFFLEVGKETPVSDLVLAKVWDAGNSAE